MKKNKLLSLLLVFLLFLSGCAGQEKEAKGPELLTSPYKKTEFMMGTVVTIKIYDEGKEAVLESVFDRIKYLAAHITVNENEEKSEIDEINRQAGVEPVKVSKDIYELIEAGEAYSIDTKGSFDITIGPLTNLWRIGFPDARKPEQAEIDAILPLIDYGQVELNKKEQTVFLKKQGMQLDLGSIAKGFIADEVVEVLKENDVTTAIIDLGGNIYVLGNNPSGREWTVGIQDPLSTRGATIGKISEANKSIVTSGIYERYLEVGGKTYHHLLNPDDGYPYMNDIAGVSIVSEKSIDGDGLSTSLFSKGIQGGLEFIEQYEDTEAIFISTDNKVYVTSGLKDNFELTNDEFEMAE
ncbi:FAD:protein FMN transferase [Bacillus tuaregi]|uniref:FAD:protein FMN transferase n=1 Tax=Bacillus tuaregi TaxID=1816695 RepID=UPI0008F7EACE|nr:FAD:protein FMN transferase [Bacillus tuaregi]